ncbi:hypothetical protein [Pseudoalteromonas fuliginea]|uniref:Uncharacterized protein n=1 Tax=Pseudoalteromonas fuliginea TaxID=1872678 RepID=A0ABD3Y426_9GAMM|nr:hypothetical protein [Pseudoalteromonas fuliginea]KDC48454.1 hypothetical protein DC53_19885 [Pseudoalteromonas fuliginea]KJZ21898.1 hypothetical protein TW82_19930 [Pseudoalteromonas fuliginea]
MKNNQSEIINFIKKNKERLSEITQNKLLTESQMIKFVRDCSIIVSGAVTGDPSKFKQLNWINSDELAEQQKILFHPFRLLPIYIAIEQCSLHITPTSTIYRDTFFDFLKQYMNRHPKLEVIKEKVNEYDLISSLAIILEPLYWPFITSQKSFSTFYDETKFDNLVNSYQKDVHNLLKKLDVEFWSKAHTELRCIAAKLDGNENLYVLLRLSPWEKRKKLKSHIAAALWIRHIAEVIRLGFQSIHGVEWPEEDIAFGQWPKEARERAYGSIAPIKDSAKSKPHLAFEFGLHTGSIVRWYLEGETEYFAANHMLPGASNVGIELINLKGAVGKERANAALRLSDNLKQDRKLRRLSFITFDTDVRPVVKAINQQLSNKGIVGYVNANSPDFEFGNFTLTELIKVVCQLESENDNDVSRIKEEDWSEVKTGKAFEAKYKSFPYVSNNVLKGPKWGVALAKYMLEKPYIAETQTIRPFYETFRNSLIALRVKYEYQEQYFRIEPNTFTLKRLNQNEN